MPKIFVSYRRKVSQATAGRIFDRLSAYYGKGSVFIDIDDIPAGDDFRQRISLVLNEVQVVIALVGPKWIGSAKQGRTWINRENDWVRLEIESAMRRSLPIIPVLVDGATMPDAGDLPESMKDFVYRNAVVVASGLDFHAHVDRLIRSIDQILQPSRPKPAVIPVTDARSSAEKHAAKPEADTITLPPITGGEAAASGTLESGIPKPETPGKARLAPIVHGLIRRKYFAAVAAVLAVSALGYFTNSYFSIPSEPRMIGGVTDTERDMSKSIGELIQTNLCVAKTAVFDAATRAAIYQAKLGASTFGLPGTPFHNVSDQIVSKYEAQIFLAANACNFDGLRTERGYRTAFEKFAFTEESQVKAFQIRLANCEPNLKDKATGRFDALTRNAIKIAKSKMNPVRRSELTDIETDTLNDRSNENIWKTCL